MEVLRMAEKVKKTSEFKNLLSPIEIKGVEIPNRIVMAPMNTLLSMDNSGKVNEEVLAYYAARAKGGCGLIITECVLGTELASRFPYGSNLHLYKQSHFPGIAELGETIRAFGARAFIQMSIGFGRQGHSHDGEHPPAPSVIPYTTPVEMYPKVMLNILEKNPAAIAVANYMGTGHIPCEMTIDEIHTEQDEFANSCRFAKLAQFDGIELHAPHGYLEHQFLSPRSNKRTDMYGGSLDNRMRFLAEVYLKVREAVGFDYVVGMRMSADEHMPEGFTHEEALEVGRRMGEMGIDYFHLSDGSYEAFKYFMPEKDGTMLEEAANFKKVLNVPVICVSIHDPKKGEEAVASGKCDMVSLGRQMLCDPDYGVKLAEGRPKDIRRCRRCNLCLMYTIMGLPVRCAINHDLGREKYIPEYWRPAAAPIPAEEAVFPPTMPAVG
jgi:2,4-dienoyl-CoA reductase-like NADH-dependent reductase (Old Yellow Enzyme family)